jgi:hypothetical protein
MAGKLGQDFDATDPADNSQVRLGAGWIRDIKSRLKAFADLLFSLETGKLKPNVIPPSSLVDISPSPAGTWREVDVSSKGLVTAGRNPSELVQVPRFFRGVFTAGAGAVVDNDTGITTIADPGPSVYPGSGVYHKAYQSNGQYYAYNWEVPVGVRRITVWAVGAGGGAQSNGGGSRHSGATGEHREGTMPVTPGTNITILVGGGGTGVWNPGASANPGGTSMVSSGSTYIEAAGGDGAAGAPGLGQVGIISSNIYTLLFPGLAGVAVTPWAVDGLSYFHSGSYPYGSSGFAGTDQSSTEAAAEKGIVIIEWVK